MKLSVLGMDPSLSNWGMALGEYCSNSDIITIGDVGVISAAIPKGKNVRQNSKDLERTHELSNELFDILKKANPQVIFVEVPHGSQSARAMVSYGVCIALLAAIRTTTDFPMFEVTAREVKQAAVGKNKATKQEMIDWGTSTYSQINWPTKTEKGITSVVEGKAEHIADAIASIHAGIYQSSEFAKYLQVLKQLTQGKRHANQL